MAVENYDASPIMELAPILDGKYLKLIQDDGVPLEVVLRMAENDKESYDNEQDADKRLSNSSYGFTSTDPKKGKLPLLELGNTTTTMGKFQLGLAKSVAQKITAKTHRKIYGIKKKLQKDGGIQFKGELCAEDLVAMSKVSRFSNPIANKKVFKKNHPSREHSPLRFTNHRTVQKRDPPMDCSVLLHSLPQGWVCDNDMLLCSKYKNDVFYGDTDSVMLALDETVFGGTNPEKIKQGFDAGRYCASMINAFEWQILWIILEKLSHGTYMEKKKSYKMRLVHEATGKFNYFLEKGSTVKRDVLPFVQKTIDAHSGILHKIGEGYSVADIRDEVAADIKKRMAQLYAGEVDVKDLACKKKVSRLVYKSASSTPTHAVVAAKMKQRGNTVVFGDYVTYSMYVRDITKAETESFRKLQYPKSNGNRSKTLRNVRNVRKRPAHLSTNNVTENAPQQEEDEDVEEEEGAEVYKMQLPNRKINGKDTKARDIAEDLEYIQQHGLPLDIKYIYQHQIQNALLMHFSHILFPAEEVHYVDPYYSTPEEAAVIKAKKKKALARQQEETRRLVFWDFEKMLRLMWIALYENAYDDYHPLPLSFNRYVKKTRHHRCSFCAKVEKVEVSLAPKVYRPHVALSTNNNNNNNNNNNTATGKNNVTLPSFVCRECSENSKVTLDSLKRRTDFLKFRKQALDQLCRGCACLLDKPDLDTDKCKSSHCVVYQRKAETAHYVKATEEKVRLLTTQLPQSQSW